MELAHHMSQELAHHMRKANRFCFPYTYVHCSQIEKEALSCIFGITKFHSYFYDHGYRSLSLFKEQKLTGIQR